MGVFGLQEVRHVRNVDADLKVAGGQRPNMQRIINVPAAWGIHAADGQLPEVFPALADITPSLSTGPTRAVALLAKSRHPQQLQPKHCLCNIH